MKVFKVHSAPLTDLQVSGCKGFLVTCSVDKTMRLFDCRLFPTLLHTYKLEFVPECASVIDDPFLSRDPVILVCPRDKQGLYLIRNIAGGDDPHYIHSDLVFTEIHYTLHRTLLLVSDCSLLSFDIESLLQNANDDSLPKPVLQKSLDSRPCRLSSNKRYLAFWSSDRFVRVLCAKTLKPLKKFDETVEFYEKAVEAGKLKANPSLFNTEQDIVKTPYFTFQTCCFDPRDENVMLFPSAVGLKIVDLESSKMVSVYGRLESKIRFTNGLIIEPEKDTVSLDLAASDNPRANLHSRAVVLGTGFRQNRFFLFTDTKNERQDLGCDHFPVVKIESATQTTLSDGYRPTTQAVIRTTMGDIFVELYPNQTPLTVQNFLTLASRKYYDNLLFHRIIRGFMIQTGCPRGDGTGGDSIFGGPFKTELSAELKHDRPFTLSMANKGDRHSNTSQFFITTIRAPWLDRKHTVFGRVTGGEDVVKKIEHVDTDKLDRPKQDVRVITIEPIYH